MSIVPHLQGLFSNAAGQEGQPAGYPTAASADYLSAVKQAGAPQEPGGIPAVWPAVNGNRTAAGGQSADGAGAIERAAKADSGTHAQSRSAQAWQDAQQGGSSPQPRAGAQQATQGRDAGPAGEPSSLGADDALWGVPGAAAAAAAGAGEASRSAAAAAPETAGWPLPADGAGTATPAARETAPLPLPAEQYHEQEAAVQPHSPQRTMSEVQATAGWPLPAVQQEEQAERPAPAKRELFPEGTVPEGVHEEHTRQEALWVAQAQRREQAAAQQAGQQTVLGSYKPQAGDSDAELMAEQQPAEQPAVRGYPEGPGPQPVEQWREGQAQPVSRHPEGCGRGPAADAASQAAGLSTALVLAAGAVAAGAAGLAGAGGTCLSLAGAGRAPLSLDVWGMAECCMPCGVWPCLGDALQHAPATQQLSMRCCYLLPVPDARCAHAGLQGL